MTVLAGAAVPDIAEQQTAALLALLDACANAGVARAALLVQVAALPPDLRRPHHLRLIDSALDPLAVLDRSVRYKLADGSVVVVWRGEAADATPALETLERLFAGLDPPPFAVLHLPRDTPVLARAVAESLPQATPPPPAAGRRLDPPSLMALESALAQADISRFARLRPVCQWPEGGPPVLAWDRRCLSPRELIDALAPGVDPMAEPWLFRRLTRSFDKRLLAGLSDPWELREAGPFSLDLNVASLLTVEFLRFDATLPAPLRGQVCIAFRPDDVLADPPLFRFVRDFARARHYRLALRGMTLPWLEALPADQLGLDLLWLTAPSHPAATLPPALAPRIVLSDVRDDAALAWGRQHGVAFYEGPIVRPPPRPRIPPHLTRARV